MVPVKFKKNFKGFLSLYSKSSIIGDEPWRYVCSDYSAFYTIEPILAIGQLWSAVFASLGVTLGQI